jgi:hypothetical protein
VHAVRSETDSVVNRIVQGALLGGALALTLVLVVLAWGVAWWLGVAVALVMAGSGLGLVIDVLFEEKAS